MGALFVSASSQRLVNSAPPLITYPFTVGLWAMPIGSTGSGYAWSMCAVANTNHLFGINVAGISPFFWNVGAGAGGSLAAAPDGSAAVAANRWNFIVARFISATNRRISALDSAGGGGTGAQQTTSLTPVVDTVYIGCKGGSAPGAFFDGVIGEYWMTNTDIQPDGLTLSAQTLRALAYYGPFFVPNVAASLVEYRSLRQSMGSDQDVGSDYFRLEDRQTWLNTNGVKQGPHCPHLTGGYWGPTSFIRPGIV